MSQSSYAQINTLDKERIFDVIDGQPNQLRQNYADTMREDITAIDGIGIDNIVFVGMGGSALAGSIASDWLGSRLLVPFEVVRGSNLPGYVNHSTLVIVSSYSGNTEETLLAFVQATRLNARVITITRDGELTELSKNAGIISLQLPDISQPRLAVFAGLKALTCILEDTKLVNGGDLRRELEDTADYLDTQKLRWGTDKQGGNQAKDLASHLHTKPGIIYASPLLKSASYKWKIDINENAKQMAFCDVFSELNHNEMQGWLETNEVEYASIVLCTSFEDSSMQKRIDITAKLLEKYGYEPKAVTASGSNHIQQLLETVLLGDYVSAYLAILNGIDPTPVKLVEQFKKDLALEI